MINLYLNRKITNTFTKNIVGVVNLKIILMWVISTIVNYIIVATIIDWILMGRATPKIYSKNPVKSFFIHKDNRIELQQNLECSAFSSGYILRHFDIAAKGEDLYQMIPNKMKSGYVYPKGIVKLLGQYNIKTKYRMGTINSLKQEICKGNPIIVLIRYNKDKNWLHFVPVVGFDENKIYIAESLKEFINSDNELYNREVEIDEFKKLWNTRMIKMPLYANTYITFERT